MANGTEVPCEVSVDLSAPDATMGRMPPRRRVPLDQGRAAVATWQEAPTPLDRSTLATAVRFALEELGARAPGRSVEVRVPPFGAVQCIDGLQHKRGTPPNVVETDADTWLRLATGAMAWDSAWDEGLVRMSGTRADLTAYLPLWPPPTGTDT